MFMNPLQNYVYNPEPRINGFPFPLLYSPFPDFFEYKDFGSMYLYSPMIAPASDILKFSVLLLHVFFIVIINKQKKLSIIIFLYVIDRREKISLVFDHY